MDGAIAGERRQLQEFGRGHGAKAVRGDADRLARRLVDHAPTILEEPRERRDVGDEPPLFGRRLRAAEGRMGVEHRQERDSDAGAAGRSEDSTGHFRRLLIRRAVWSIVEIVELGDGGEPCLQHLDIELRGDRLHIIRRHREREPIHRLAPGPERVGLLAPRFGEPGHGALEGMAVQVHGRRRHDRVKFIPLLR